MKGKGFVNTMLSSALLVSIGSTIQAEDTDESIVEAERVHIFDAAGSDRHHRRPQYSFLYARQY